MQTAKITCKDCGSENLIQRGYNAKRDKKRTECKDCGGYDSFPVELFENEIISKSVFIFDIETSIRRAFLFGTGEQYVGGDAFEDFPLMLGWSGKYAGDSKVYSDFVTREEVLEKDHSRVVLSLWEKLSTVHLSASYNGDRFDVPYVNSFFAKQDLGLPNRIRNIDPCRISRSVFRLDSYKMDYIVKYFGLDDGKHKMERQDWLDCYYGDKTALKKMEEYCKHDIEILELVLDKVKPYYPALPNMGIYGNVEKSVCPCCGGINFSDNGNIPTSMGLYNSYRCNDCKALFRSRINLFSKEKRKSIMAF